MGNLGRGQHTANGSSAPETAPRQTAFKMPYTLLRLPWERACHADASPKIAPVATDRKHGERKHPVVDVNMFQKSDVLWEKGIDCLKTAQSEQKAAANRLQPKNVADSSYPAVESPGEFCLRPRPGHAKLLPYR
jgi:hypothetical protein